LASAKTRERYDQRAKAARENARAKAQDVVKSHEAASNKDMDGLLMASRAYDLLAETATSRVMNRGRTRAQQKDSRALSGEMKRQAEAADNIKREITALKVSSDGLRTELRRAETELTEMTRSGSE